MRLAILVCLILALPQPAGATVLHVPADYPTIGAATAVAVPGDEVLVAAGTYNERFTLGPGQDGVKIHSESGPAVTIIDGGYTGSVVSMTLVGSGTELVGFTVTHGGHAPAMTSDLGGALRIEQSSPKIDNDIITQSSSFRGAVYVNVGSPTIDACVIDGNVSFAGGGIYVLAGSPVITGNTITNNQSTAGGGGILAFTSTVPDIENNVIRSNTCNSRGGGIDLAGSAGGFVGGNQIINNTATTGGGLCLVGVPAVSITDNVFQGDTSFTDAGGGLAILASNPTVENNQFLNNSGGVGAGGIYASGSAPTIRHNLVQDNDSPHGSGGGIYLDQGSSGTIEKNVILRNHCVAWGGGVTIWGSTPTLTSNTIALNKGDLGGGNVYVRRNSTVTLQANILSHSPQQGIEQDDIDGISTVTLSCNDVSNNAGGNYAGLPDPSGSNGNFSLDPLFCDLMALDVHLSSTSPCASAHSPAGCGLVGALDVNCDGPVRTQPTTWGGLKAMYH